LSFTTGHYSSKSKPWLITFDYNYQEIIIRKAHKYNTNENTVSITHWLTKHDPSYTSLYPLSTINCTRCTGCIHNSNRIQNYCTFDIPANSATKFLGQKRYNNTNELNLYANYLDLIYSIAL